MPKKVRESFSFTAEGDEHTTVVLEDDNVSYADNHPWVKAYPERFKDAAEGQSFVDVPSKKSAKVEQATAAPGEERAVDKP